MGLKASLISFFILVVIALLLWYRNANFDRALAIFAFTLASLQLIEYGIYNHANPEQSGNAIFIVLWLQCLMVIIAVFVYNKVANSQCQFKEDKHKLVELVAGFSLLLYSLVFIVALFIVYTGQGGFSANVSADGQSTEWTSKAGSILGNFTWLYIVGLFLPFILLLAFYSWSSLAIGLFILYGVVSAIYVLNTYPMAVFGSKWSMLAIGVVFLAYMVNINSC